MTRCRAGRLAYLWCLLLSGLLGLPARAQTVADTITALIEHSRDQYNASQVQVAMPTMQRALALARRAGHEQLASRAQAYLAGYYGIAGDNRLAQATYEAALASAQRAHWPQGIADAYVGMYEVAYDQGDYQGSLRWLQQAARYYARVQPTPANAALLLDNQLTLYIDFSTVYTELHQPQRAARACRAGLALARQGARPVDVVVLLQNLGDAQLLAHHPDSARQSFGRSLRLAPSPTDSAFAYEALARCALALRQPAVAYGYARQARHLAQRTGHLETVATSLHTLAATLHALRRPQAYDTLHQYVVLHDSLLDQQRTAAIVHAQARFDSRAQQAQIRALQQDRRLAAQQQELARLRTRQQWLGAGGLAALLLLLAGGGFWQYRRRQQAQRAHAATALRQRLAADLHDDVGNLLTQVSVQSDVLRELVPAAAPLHARLDALADTARHAAQQMTEVVLNLHAELHTLPQLLARLHDHAYQVLPLAGLEVEFRVPHPLPPTPLPPEVLHHLYLIYKEALHNVAKHARASLVTITLAARPGTLTLTIADDGRGHDGTPRPGGHGLRNMQARAQSIGGTVRYEPQAAGFAVVAQVPMGGR